MTNLQLQKYADYEFKYLTEHYCLAIFVFEKTNNNKNIYIDIWSSKFPKINTGTKSITVKTWISEHSKLKFYRDQEALNKKLTFINFIREDILKNFSKEEFLEIKEQAMNTP